MSESLSLPSSVAPVLSTPDTHIFEAYTAAVPPVHSKLSDELLGICYQIDWTAREIRRRRWCRIALQFPDQMLPDAPRVFELLKSRLRSLPRLHASSDSQDGSSNIEEPVPNVDTAKNTEHNAFLPKDAQEQEITGRNDVSFYILGDTSYGACCVDEIAAEHISADAVVHYGRACLSPTSKLPVLHVFTVQPFDESAAVSTFEATYPDKNCKVLLVADVTYSSHVPSLATRLAERGYTSIFATEVLHDPSALIPNRTVPTNLSEVAGVESPLSDWHLFHISKPPSALLLTLVARVASIRIYPTHIPVSYGSSASALNASLATPMPLLRRRYGLLTRLRTASVIGILINTLSASSTLPVLTHLKALIANADKKSYTVVVGKVNAAKLANFAEVDGWVVVGCWESSLLEDDEGKGGTGWWKPCVTPWELEAALGPEGSGMTGWRTDLESLLSSAAQHDGQKQREEAVQNGDALDSGVEIDAGPLADEEESEPPVFDLRTGKYVSTSRPMHIPKGIARSLDGTDAGALARRRKGDLVTIHGEASPGAAFLRGKRTWRGLGSDFEIAYEEEQGTQLEEGRSGLARGYIEEHEHR